MKRRELRQCIIVRDGKKGKSDRIFLGKSIEFSLKIIMQILIKTEYFRKKIPFLYEIA